MSTLAHLLLPYLLMYKYWALFVLTFVAALILPIPPGTLIMGAAAMSYEGYMHFGWVLTAAILGNILGDNIGYALARRYGKQALRGLGFGGVFDSPRYASLERRLRRKPGFIIFISRFEVFANLSVNLMCGLTGVPYRKYILYETIGEIAQVGLYATAGYLFAPSWQIVNQIIGRSMMILLALLVAVAIIYRKRIIHWFSRE